MGLFPRILKNLAALVASRLVGVIQQVVIPPLFIWRYSDAGFGEWSTLYGAVGALVLLNFGVQTYMNQDLAVRYQRGELAGYALRQSTALRLVLGVVLCTAVLLLGLFLLPVDNMLKLHLSRSASQWTLYLLSLYILVSIPSGYIAGLFMGAALAHRGSAWMGIQNLLSALGLLAGVLFHVSFPALAAILIAMLLLVIVSIYFDIRRTAPDLAPRLRGWDGSAVKDILRGSGYFAILETSTFLTYAVPLVLLQRTVGPVAVASFVLMRTIFSMARQMLSMFTQSMGAEITNLYGRRDWPALARLYDYSERVVFWLIAFVNVLVLMLSPVLITVWLRRKGHAGHVSELFSVMPYVLTSAISMVISLKEHKYQFQVSTNTHEEWARVTFFGYLAMIAISVGTVHVAGVNGFLVTWLVVEAFQVARLLSMNTRLFAHVKQLDNAYITRLGSICVLALFVATFTLRTSSLRPLWQQAVLALVAASIVGGLSWKLFGMRPVVADMAGRLRKLRA